MAPEPPPGDATGGSDATDAPQGPDAVEQLQRAILTLIGTARVALDALETLVADRRRLDELAASGRQAVATLSAAVSGWCDDPEGASDQPGPPSGESTGEAAPQP